MGKCQSLIGEEKAHRGRWWGPVGKAGSQRLLTDCPRFSHLCGPTHSESWFPLQIDFYIS